MAVDTAIRRHSALTFGLPFMRGLIPDGSLDQADRQTVTYSYGGILAGLTIPDVIVDTISFVLGINRSESIAANIKTSESLAVDIQTSIGIQVEG